MKYILYEKSTGNIINISDKWNYDKLNDILVVGSLKLQGINWGGISIGASNLDIPSYVTNISDISDLSLVFDGNPFTPDVLQKASIFRSLLRKHFGDNAETNHTITEVYVNGYFLLTNNLTGDDVRDGAYIKDLFVELSKLTDDGTTWSFPWQLVP